MARSMVRRGNRRLALALANAGGLVGGALLDAAFGDPRRFHPTAGYGRLAGALERRLYTPTRSAGAGYAAVAVGAPVALAATQLLRSQLHDVHPADPIAIGTALVVLTACAIVAALLPARRAARLDPLAALRVE